MQNRRNSTRNQVERMYPIVAECKDCGREFTISVKEQLFAQENKGFTLPKRCPDCRNERRNKNKQIVCMDCGEVFEFTANEQDFYERNGFAEPKRCKACRKVRKDNANGQNISEEDK